MTAIAEQTIYETHANGGGKRERTVTCSESAYLDADTLVEGYCSVWGSPRIEQSRLMGFCRISGHGFISNAALDGRVSVSDSTQIIDSSIVTDQRISGNVFEWGEVEIRDAALVEACTIDAPPSARIGIGGNAILIVVDIRGNAHIEGDAHLENCEIPDGAWITGGQWLCRAPKVIKTSSFFNLTESHIPGELFVGCRSLPIKTWIRSGKMLAAKYGMPLDEYYEYARLVLEWNGTSHGPECECPDCETMYRRPECLK